MGHTVIKSRAFFTGNDKGEFPLPAGLKRKKNLPIIHKMQYVINLLHGMLLVQIILTSNWINGSLLFPCATCKQTTNFLMSSFAAIFLQMNTLNTIVTRLESF